MRPVPLALLTSAALAAMALAGCSEEVVQDPTGPATQGPLKAGKGAIAGLLIDDVYRPVPGGLVLLQELGLTATTDGLGQFQFVDLEPGTYFAIANAPGHEAAPVNVDVVAGEYAELEVQARRIFNNDGHVITTQYAVFIPCAADYVVNGYIVSCVPDSSGDTYRPGFTTDVTAMGSNITYMVNEARMNKVGDYDFQVREDNGQSAGGARYAVASLRDTDYVKILNQYGVQNVEHNGQNNNVAWNNSAPFVILVFMSGSERETFHGVSNTTCQPDVDDVNRGLGSPVRTCNWRGVGAQFGIKATFIQSLFVGEPLVDVQPYCVLCRNEA